MLVLVRPTTSTHENLEPDQSARLTGSFNFERKCRHKKNDVEIRIFIAIATIQLLHNVPYGIYDAYAHGSSVQITVSNDVEPEVPRSSFMKLGI